MSEPAPFIERNLQGDFNSTDQGWLTFEAVVLELVSFGVRDVGGPLAVVLGRQLQLLLPVAGAAAAGQLLVGPGSLRVGADRTEKIRGRARQSTSITSSFMSVRLIVKNHREFMNWNFIIIK